MKTVFLIDGIDVNDVPTSPTPPPTRADLRSQRRAERRAAARQSLEDFRKDKKLAAFAIDTSFSVVKCIFIALLLVNFFRALRGDVDYFSFARLFDVLQNAPSIPIDWISTFSINIKPEDWGDWTEIFNWLRDALVSVVNFFGASVSAVLYVSTGIGNLVVFVGYFVSKLFF